MKYVNRVPGPNGTQWLYFRKKGCPRVRLTSAWGTPELAAEVEALAKALAPQKVTAGTLREALRNYELRSADFRILADSTKYVYRLYLKEFEEDMGALPIGAFTPAFVMRLKDAWAANGHRAANMRLQVLSNVLHPCLVAGTLDKDPFPLVGQVRRPPELVEPHRIWPMQVVEAVLEAAIEAGNHGLARAVALGRFVGARRGDLVVISKAARQGGRIRFLSGKRRVPVNVEEDPELTRWLDRTLDAPPNKPRAGRKLKAGESVVQPMTLVFNLAGRAYTESGLQQALDDVVDRLHKAGRIDTDEYDLHGLRHTRGVEAALAGCTDAQGAALMGHRDARSFVQYRRQAERLQLADDGAEKIRQLRERAVNTEVTNIVPRKCQVASENET